MLSTSKFILIWIIESRFIVTWMRFWSLKISFVSFLSEFGWVKSLFASDCTLDSWVNFNVNLNQSKMKSFERITTICYAFDIFSHYHQCILIMYFLNRNTNLWTRVQQHRQWWWTSTQYTYMYIPYDIGSSVYSNRSIWYAKRPVCTVYVYAIQLEVSHTRRHMGQNTSRNIHRLSH